MSDRCRLQDFFQISIRSIVLSSHPTDDRTEDRHEQITTLGCQSRFVSSPSPSRGHTDTLAHNKSKVNDARTHCVQRRQNKSSCARSPQTPPPPLAPVHPHTPIRMPHSSPHAQTRTVGTAFLLSRVTGALAHNTCQNTMTKKNRSPLISPEHISLSSVHIIFSFSSSSSRGGRNLLACLLLLGARE